MDIFSFLKVNSTAVLQNEVLFNAAIGIVFTSGSISFLLYLIQIRPKIKKAIINRRKYGEDYDHVGIGSNNQCTVLPLEKESKKRISLQKCDKQEEDMEEEVAKENTEEKNLMEEE